MTGETKLAPCPFCGAPAELDTRSPFRHYRTGEPLDQVSVFCTSCSACIAWYPGDLGLCREETAEHVITAWNTRTPDLQSKLDRATEALERSREGWENAVEMGLIPPQHVNTARILADEARATLAAIKDQSND